MKTGKTYRGIGQIGERERSRDRENRLEEREREVVLVEIVDGRG